MDEQMATMRNDQGTTGKGGSGPGLRLPALAVKRSDLRSGVERHGFPAGASRRSSSDQLSTTFNCVGGDSCSPALTIFSLESIVACLVMALE